MILGRYGCHLLLPVFRGRDRIPEECHQMARWSQDPVSQMFALVLQKNMFKYQFIQFSFFGEYTHKLQKKGSPHHLWLYNPCIWHNDILLYLNNFFPFFFWLCHVTNKILVFLTRDGVHAPTLGAWSLNHWTYREAPVIFFSLLIKKNFFILGCAGSSFRHRGSSSWRVGLSSCSTWA